MSAELREAEGGYKANTNRSGRPLEQISATSPEEGIAPGIRRRNKPISGTLLPLLTGQLGADPCGYKRELTL